MKKTKAIKMIYEQMNYRGISGGLPKAVDIYKYLTANEEIAITAKIIFQYFIGR